MLCKPEAIGRIERDYLDGAITAEQWNHLGMKLSEKLKAAQQAATRAQEHADRCKKAGGLADAEESPLRYLGRLRAAIAGPIDQAPDLNALRTGSTMG